VRPSGDTPLTILAGDAISWKYTVTQYWKRRQSRAWRLPTRIVGVNPIYVSRGDTNLDGKPRLLTEAWIFLRKRDPRSSGIYANTGNGKRVISPMTLGHSTAPQRKRWFSGYFGADTQYRAIKQVRGPVDGDRASGVTPTDHPGGAKRSRWKVYRHK